MISRRLLMGGGGSFTPPPILSAVTLTSAPDGGWTWFIDPRAVQYNGTTYIAWEQGTGNPEVAAFVGNAIVGSPFDLNTEAVDDHKNPALLVRDSDKRVLVFFCGHNETPMYLRISTNPEDVSAFGAKVDLDPSIGGTAYTYPNPFQLLGEASDPIYLFFRDQVGGVSEWHYSKSTDDGATWAAAGNVHGFTYQHCVQTGDRLDFCVSNHPQDAGDHSVYHFYYSGGNLYKTDGTLIGALGASVLGPSDVTLVYDGSTTIGWVWDVARNGSGYPIIVYATFPGAVPGTSAPDHRYNYAAWSGSAWASHQIVAGGGPIPTADAPGAGNHQEFYSGGVVLDQSDPSVAYCSVEVAAGRWDIYRYQTSDDGTSWTNYALTSSGKNVRPVSVRNHASGLQVVWMTGTYASYLSYSVGTTGAGT